MNIFLDDAIQTRKSRILSGRAWLLLPPIICVVLVMLLVNLINSLNEPSSQNATLSQIKSSDLSHGGLRLVIFLKEEIVHIQVSKDQTIKIASQELLAGNTEALDQYLEQSVRDLARSAVLSGGFLSDHIFVTLAVDEHLSYALLKPIIRSLGKAKLTRYGFEVQTATLTLSQRDNSDRDSHENEH